MRLDFVAIGGGRAELTRSGDDLKGRGSGARTPTMDLKKVK